MSTVTSTRSSDPASWSANTTDVPHTNPTTDPNSTTSVTPTTTDTATTGTPTTTTTDAPDTASVVQPDGTVVSDEDRAASDVEQHLQAWVGELASDDWSFHRAMERAFGEAYDRGHAERVRQAIVQGQFEVPPIRFGEVDPTGGAAGIVLAPELAEQPLEAARTAAAHLIGSFAPEGSNTVDPAQFVDELDPARHGGLQMYFAQEPANEASVPPLLASGGLEYGSIPVNQAPVSHDGVTDDWCAGWIGTPTEVYELDEGGIGNLMNPEWRDAVAEAARQNGGLGNSEDGFLAWSRDYGFHRLRNPRLTPEQNRRLAEMSLTLGVPTETIPSRTIDSAILDPDIDKWVNEIVGRFDTEMAAFKADPTDGVSVSDGRKRYVLEFNEDAGRFVSYDFKKSGGLKGFFQKNLDVISPVLDVVSLAVNVIPGIGQAASMAIAAGSQVLKTAGQVIATGTLKAQQVAGLVTSFLPQIGTALNLTKTQTALVGGLTNAGAQAIDTGKFDVSQLVAAAAPSLIQGLPGGPAMDRAVQASAVVTAKAIEDGRIDARDALGLIDLIGQAWEANTSNGATSTTAADAGFFDGLKDTLLDELGIDSDTAALFEQIGRPIAKIVSGGDLTAKDVSDALFPIAERMTDDKAVQTFLKETFAGVANSIDTGRIDAEIVFDRMLPAFMAAFGERPEALTRPAAA